MKRKDDGDDKECDGQGPSKKPKTEPLPVKNLKYTLGWSLVLNFVGNTEVFRLRLVSQSMLNFIGNQAMDKDLFRFIYLFLRKTVNIWSGDDDRLMTSLEKIRVRGYIKQHSHLFAHNRKLQDFFKSVLYIGEDNSQDAIGAMFDAYPHLILPQIPKQRRFVFGTGGGYYDKAHFKAVGERAADTKSVRSIEFFSQESHTVCDDSCMSYANRNQDSGREEQWWERMSVGRRVPGVSCAWEDGVPISTPVGYPEMKEYSRCRLSSVRVAAYYPWLASASGFGVRRFVNFHLYSNLTATVFCLFFFVLHRRGQYRHSILTNSLSAVRPKTNSLFSAREMSEFTTLYTWTV